MAYIARRNTSKLYVVAIASFCLPLGVVLLYWVHLWLSWQLKLVLFFFLSLPPICYSAANWYFKPEWLAQLRANTSKIEPSLKLYTLMKAWCQLHAFSGSLAVFALTGFLPPFMIGLSFAVNSGRMIITNAEVHLGKVAKVLYKYSRLMALHDLNVLYSPEFNKPKLLVVHVGTVIAPSQELIALKLVTSGVIEYIVRNSVIVLAFDEDFVPSVVKFWFQQYQNPLVTLGSKHKELGTTLTKSLSASRSLARQPTSSSSSSSDDLSSSTGKAAQEVYDELFSGVVAAVSKEAEARRKVWNVLKGKITGNAVRVQTAPYANLALWKAFMLPPSVPIPFEVYVASQSSLRFKICTPPTIKNRLWLQSGKLLVPPIMAEVFGLQPVKMTALLGPDAFEAASKDLGLDTSWVSSYHKARMFAEGGFCPYRGTFVPPELLTSISGISNIEASTPILLHSHSERLSWRLEGWMGSNFEGVLIREPLQFRIEVTPKIAELLVSLLSRHLPDFAPLLKLVQLQGSGCVIQATMAPRNLLVPLPLPLVPIKDGAAGHSMAIPLGGGDTLYTVWDLLPWMCAGQSSFLLSYLFQWYGVDGWHQVGPLSFTVGPHTEEFIHQCMSQFKLNISQAMTQAVVAEALGVTPNLAGALRTKVAALWDKVFESLRPPLTEEFLFKFTTSYIKWDVSEGGRLLTIPRQDVLIAPDPDMPLLARLHLAVWGKLDLRTWELELTLGVGVLSVKRVPGIMALDPNYVLPIRVTGSLMAPRFDYSKAAAQIVQLLASATVRKEKESKGWSLRKVAMRKHVKAMGKGGLDESLAWLESDISKHSNGVPQLCSHFRQSVGNLEDDVTGGGDVAHDMAAEYADLLKGVSMSP